MFIELTDHLICPGDHPEQYLVLLPGEMDGRRVVSGELGCPVCGRVVRVMEGAVEFSAPPPPASPSSLGAAAIAAFLGLSGPGGFVALAGSPAAAAPDLEALIPGVALVLVNPPAGTPDRASASVLRADRLPLKRGSMRGVVVGPEFAAESRWIHEAERVTLPGLRIVAEGGHPSDSLRLLGRTPGCWVAEKAGAGKPDE